MRRFSQRNSLVTLNEINITPLLDLAFVLLIIFVITTPLLEQGINLKLPKGGRADKPDAKNITTVEVSPDGRYMLRKQWRTLSQVEAALAAEARANPDLVVYVRAQSSTPMGDFAQLIDALERHDIRRYSIRTSPPEKKR